jgi:hypothetical protein
VSIDATVWNVTREFGDLKLWLKDREPWGCTGQAALLVVGTCRSAEQLVGRDIWAAGSGPIMCGDTAVGRRIGYTRCVLWNHGIREAIAAQAAKEEKDG